MKKTRITLTLAILLAIVAGVSANSQAQTKLEENATLAKLIGNWATTTEDGRAVNISYRWALNKNAVISRFNMGGQYAGYGLIYYDAGQKKILHCGVDSAGGFGTGHWQFNDENAVWKMKYVGANSDERKMGIVYTREGRKTLKLEYYGLDDAGNISGEPTRTTELEKQPAKQKKARLPQSSQTATLGDLVDTGGVDWIIGNWGATTEEGQSLNSSYTWDMNKNLIKLSFKMGEYEGLGLIFYSPQEGKVIQVGADSRGGVSKGSWDAEEENLAASLEFAAADGNKGKFVIVHANIDAKRMKVAFYGIGESGDRMPNPWATMEYKRQPKKTAAPTKDSN